MTENINNSDHDDKSRARALWLVHKLGGDASDGKTGKCCCPAHDDENPSLDVELTKFTPNGQPLFKCRAGYEQDAVIAALRAKGSWPIPVSPSISNPGPVKQGRSREERRKYARSIFTGVRAQKWEEDKSLLLKDYFGNRGLKNVPSNAWLTMPISPGNVENQCLMLSDDPGIVFRVADRDDKFFGIHVIWLNGDLTGKREAKPHRQCHGPIKGGYIKIGELDPDKPLVVAEGIETAMAVLQITNLPCALVGCGANTADVNLDAAAGHGKTWLRALRLPGGNKKFADNPMKLDFATRPRESEWTSSTCGAQTRIGSACRRPPVVGRKRCRLHGGLSPGAPRGLKNGNFKTGDWTTDAIAEREWLRSLVQSFAKIGVVG